MSNCKTRQDIEDGGYAMVGSAETVRQKMTEMLQELGCGNILGLFQLGTLPSHLTQKNMKLFAAEVMPQLRAEFGDVQTVSQTTELTPA